MSTAGRTALGLAIALLAAGAGLPPAGRAAQTSGFPAGYSGYHTYAEMVDELDSVVAAHPDIAAKMALPPNGATSYQGRTIWALKISDNVNTDEAEPEVLFDSLTHAREHLTVEMDLHLIHLLVDGYGNNQRITDIVNNTEIWVVPMVNPDGGEYDISGDSFKNWRRNRQPVVSGKSPGIDLNRNYAFKWGCCGGSSGKPGALYYRGQYPWQAVEAAAMRDFVLSRVVGGRQQITESVTWHSFNEQIMWPYGYTYADLPRTMSPDDLDAFRALGEGMASRNGYTAQQLSDLYIADGTSADWQYGDQRIFALTIEMYPTDNSHVGGFYPPDSIIDRETTRNDQAVLWFLEQADCPYRAAGMGDTHCGPLNDDFETARGWQVNPTGDDTATSGAWRRGTPQKNKTAAGVMQRAYGFSGLAALVTGAARGSSANADDLDGASSVRSVPITLGSGSSSGWTLAFRYTFAHDTRSSSADFLRVSVGGTVVWSQTGAAANRNAAWTPVTVDLDAFAGQTVHVLIEACDCASDSLVEAAVDDVRIYQAP